MHAGDEETRVEDGNTALSGRDIACHRPVKFDRQRPRFRRASVLTMICKSLLLGSKKFAQVH